IGKAYLGVQDLLSIRIVLVPTRELPGLRAYAVPIVVARGPPSRTQEAFSQDRTHGEHVEVSAAARFPGDCSGDNVDIGIHRLGLSDVPGVLCRHMPPPPAMAFTLREMMAAPTAARIQAPIFLACSSLARRPSVCGICSSKRACTRPNPSLM